MGVIQVPRVILACGRGKAKKFDRGVVRRLPFGLPWHHNSHYVIFFFVSLHPGILRRAMKNDGWNVGHGVGKHNQHVYHGRVGIFDVDSFGHMNNAAFLSHAEYARWEMGGESGMVRRMATQNILFFVTGTFVRYRREVRPLFRSFRVETFVSAVDDRYLWFSHNFRYSATDRLRAQLVVQSVVLKKGKVLDPREFLIDECGYDEKLIQSITWPDGELVSHADLLNSYRDLDESMRSVAALDDEMHKQ